MYYPISLIRNEEIVFTKSKDYKDIDYTLNSHLEFILNDFVNECQDAAFTNDYLFYDEFYTYYKSRIKNDGIIPQFEDRLRGILRRI
jgi:hypothetical protein